MDPTAISLKPRLLDMTLDLRDPFISLYLALPKFFLIISDFAFCSLPLQIFSDSFPFTPQCFFSSELILSVFLLLWSILFIFQDTNYVSYHKKPWDKGPMLQCAIVPSTVAVRTKLGQPTM